MTYKPSPYKIIEKSQINSEVTLLTVNCPLFPQPGQFLQVSLPGIGECPLASCSYDKQVLTLLIKNAGSVTSALSNLNSGDLVYIRGPYGRGFPLNKLKNKNLIFIAGGTGIAPVTSLIEYAEKNKENFKEITIYFGFRNESFVLLKDKIKNWEKKFKVIICLDEKSANKKYRHGFVHQILAKEKIQTQNSAALLCGPQVMMKAVTEELNKQGLENSKAYWSMERRMECGIGSCGRCLIQDVYVCKDGPVFRYDFIKPRLDAEESANKEEK